MVVCHEYNHEYHRMVQPNPILPHCWDGHTKNRLSVSKEGVMFLDLDWEGKASLERPSQRVGEGG